MTKIQQEFEEWAIEHHFSTTKKLDGKSYAHDSTVCAFEGWKASRSLLNVELPSYQCDQRYKDGVLDANKVFEALEKAGVSYK